MSAYTPYVVAIDIVGTAHVRVYAVSAEDAIEKARGGEFDREPVLVGWAPGTRVKAVKDADDDAIAEQEGGAQ